jgi:hypothetical protein
MKGHVTEAILHAQITNLYLLGIALAPVIVNP